MIDYRNGLSDGREFAPEQPPPDVPGYREKYWACGFDGRAGIGFSIWLETTAADYAVWQEVVHVVLPDGRVFLSSTETHRASSTGPGGQVASGVCEQPFRRWSYRLRGALEATTVADLVRTDGERPRRTPTDVTLDLDLLSTGPAWDLAASASSKEVAFTTQYRQLFRAAGDLQIGSEPRVSLDATGFRAHSSGPYHGGTFGGHSMISVQFPSGRAAGFLRHVRPDGSATVSQAFVLDDGRLIPAELAEAPKRLERLSPGGDRFPVRLNAGAKSYLIDVEIVANVTSLRPNYFEATARTADDLAIVATHRDGLANAISYGRFSLDGETGFGIIERSTRMSALPPSSVAETRRTHVPD